MIWAHCIQILAENESYDSNVSLYVNAVTFSGFMFAFGWASQIAYLSKPFKSVKRNLIKNFLTLLAAYYVSGFGIQIITGEEHTISSFVETILLIKVQSYSEFLLSFALLVLFIIILFNPIKWISESRLRIATVIFLSAASSFFPYQLVKNQLLGSIIGTYTFPCFPILQYSMFFFAGIFFRKYRVSISPMVMLGCGILSGIGLAYRIHFGFYASRFPPIIFWLVLAWLPIASYTLISSKLSPRIGGGSQTYELVTTVGKHTLSFLVLSNLAIFGLQAYFGNDFSPIMAAISAICIFICILLLPNIKRKLRQRLTISPKSSLQ